MIGLDTNVLVRYLAQDDAVQSRQATQIIERQLTEESPGFISLVTMIETVWVLDRVYGLSNREIAAAEAVPASLARNADTLAYF
jgi:predicted nucleic-acid-binding protein